MRTTLTSTNKKLFRFAGLLLVYLLVVAICYPGLFREFSGKVAFGTAGDLGFILSIIDFSIHSPLRDL